MKKILLPLLATLSLLLIGCPDPATIGHRVIYDSNGATDGTLPADGDTYLSGESVTILTSGTLAKGDYSFEGWGVDDAGVGTVYAPGETMEMGTRDITLYAVWRRTAYIALGGGATVSLERFNDSKIYSMVTATPSTKPESEPSGAQNDYDYILSTTAAAVTASASPARASGLPRTAAPPSAKARRDQKSREMERRLLASGARQVSRNTAVKPRAAAASISVGTVWNGVKISDEREVMHSVDTTCRYISNHAYFFVDNTNIAAIEPFLDDYGTAFDEIYQVNREKFGEENDVDNNGKVIIVFSGKISGSLLGYFWSIDKYPASADNPDSNEGDIFYITADADEQIDHGDTIPATLAHEFQHMIYFDEHSDRDSESSYSWLNEALSQAAEYYNDYLDVHQEWIELFLREDYINLSLTHWTSGNYGYGAIFIRYLIDRFGDAAIKEMCATALVGIAAVEEATGEDFNTLFRDFSRAVVISGTGDSVDPKYNFTSLDLSEIQPTGRGGLVPQLVDPPFTAGEDDEYSVYPYSLEFLEWEGTFGTMSLSGQNIIGTAFGLRR